jgi:lysophospholipase L1-like esterase
LPKDSTLPAGSAPPRGAPRSRLRGLAQNALLALLSTAVCLLLVEGAARVARHFQRGGKEQRTRVLYTEYDPLLGWKKTPGARARYERREFQTDVVINSLGLRDRERTLTPAPGTFRLLALGDSYIEAFQVAEDEMVTQRLERSLSGRDCALEVINGGSTGYSTDQELLFYREEGRRFEPRVVLLFFYYNDVLYNGAARNIQLPKPLLSFRGGTPVVANYPVPRRPPVPPDASPAGDVLFAGYSVALDWVGERLENADPAAYNRLARFGLWAPTSKQALAPEFRVYMKKPPADVRLGWTMTGRILGALAQEVWKRDARLLIVYIPGRGEVKDEYWDLARRRHGITDAEWDPDTVVQRLSAIAVAERIPLLDLTPALRRATRWHSWPYFDFDGHWNALGHRVAAAEVARALKGQGWLPPCASRAVPD